MAGLIKCFTTMGALFMFVFGVAIVAGSAYLFINDDVFLGNSQLKNMFLGISLAVGIAVIGGATDGIYGICKGKGCHMCVFQIFVIICMVVFIGMAVLFGLSHEIVFDGTCSVSKNPVIEQANNIYNKSALMFCQTDCGCALDKTTAAYNSTYNDDEKNEINRYNVDPAGYKNTGNCIRNNISDAEAALFEVMGNVEKLLECSLWCSDPDTYAVSNLIYRFGDVNNGKPSYYCYDRLQDLFDKYKNIGNWSFAGAGLIMVMMFICNMYLCCCAKDRKDKRLRERFLIYESTRQQADKYDRLDSYGRRY